MTNAIIPHTQKIYTVQQIQHVCSRIFKIEQHKFVDDSFPENIENILSLYIDMALTHRAVIDRSFLTDTPEKLIQIYSKKSAQNLCGELR